MLPIRVAYGWESAMATSTDGGLIDCVGSRGSAEREALFPEAGRGSVFGPRTRLLWFGMWHITLQTPSPVTEAGRFAKRWRG